MGKAAILQPSYLPWLGFFEQMYICDIFVYLDNVQYTKNDWRNRNRIKTREGVQLLTVPVSFKFGQKINANPTIEYTLPKIISIPDSEKVIAIFEIPLCSERPHIPDISPDKRLFQKRTNKGNDYMSYEEIKF